ncbi:mechanosensitive ion channel family protein [bacterium]|nr:mechanosensitive ion channel family protein [bacterium]
MISYKGPNFSSLVINENILKQNNLNNFLNFLKSHVGTFIEIFIIISVIIVSMKIIEFLDKKIRENILIKHENSARLLSFCPILTKAAKVLVLFVIAASVMQAHGYSMTSLIAGFGIIGMAVSFAAKESIANIFGSLAILYDKVFDLGDYVIIDNVEGTVIDINLRSTKIRTLDNSVIVLPNNVVANSMITNISAIKNRRIDEVIGITYDTPNEKIEKAIEILKVIIRENDEVETDDTLIYLEKLNSSSIDIHLQAYVKYGDLANYRRVKENVILEIIRKFRAEDISFAFPSRSIYITHEN